MKKIKWVAAVYFMAIFIFFMGTAVRAEEGQVDESKFEYWDNEDGTVFITKYTGTDETVIVPAELDGKVVKTIGHNRGEPPFYECETIKHLIVQEGISEIADRAFDKCSNLQTVSLPQSLTDIGEGVFQHCTNLKSVSLPDNIEVIGKRAFEECINLESVDLPDSLVSIGASTFAKCEKLNNIDLPQGIICIENNAFYRCLGLKEIFLPDNMKVITSGCFRDCINLESVEFPDALTDIEVQAFENCRKLNSIDLPQGTINIEAFAFRDCWELKKVHLPDGLRTIGGYAFYKCGFIERMVIPDSVVSIGEHALWFGNCIIYGNPGLCAQEYASQNEGVTFRCVNHAHVITEEEIPPTCKMYGRTAGSRCTDCGMIFSGYKTIPRRCIYAWFVTVEPTVRRPGSKAYRCIRCGDLKAVNMIPKLAAPEKGDILSDSKADSYKVTKAGLRRGTVEFIASKSTKSSITVPSTVKISGVTYSVTSIAKNAFLNNKNLKKVIINGSITRINVNAFKGCTNLKTIIIKSQNLKSVGKSAFKGISPKARIKVPSECLEEYRKLLEKKGQKSTVKITK